MVFPTHSVIDSTLSELSIPVSCDLAATSHFFVGLWATPYPEPQASGTYRVLWNTYHPAAKCQNSLVSKLRLPSLVCQETAGKDAAKLYGRYGLQNHLAYTLANASGSFVVPACILESVACYVGVHIDLPMKRLS